MKYQLPIGSEITPYSTKDGVAGPAALTTVVVDFVEGDILQRIKRQTDKVEQEFICLSLGENPSRYDSYLFRSSDVEVTDQ